MKIKDYVKDVKNGKIDLNKHIKGVIEKCKKINKEYNYFVVINEKKALERVDYLIKNNLKGKLVGVPVFVKDAICVKDVQSAGGSKILEGYIPPFNATVIDKLEKEGAIIVGKTTQDEFGFGSFSTNSCYGIPKNPYDKERSCGGSSGGSGGIASIIDFPAITIGESTGGSISCPSSFCGVYGLTPTYGLVSRYGLISYASSLDKIGPMNKDIDDLALTLSIIKGYDEKDQTSLKTENKDYTKFSSIKGYKIGVPKQYFENVNEEIKQAIDKAIQVLKNLGAKIIPVDLELTKYHLSAYYIVAVSEASTNLACIDGVRYGKSEPLKDNENYNKYYSRIRSKYFTEESKRRIILGTYARRSGYRNKYYLKAMQARTLIIEDYKKLFKKVDCLLSPTMMFTAPKFKEINKLNPIEEYQSDLLTVGPNLAGIPMINIPIGFDKKGLPIGMHILSDHLNEQKILNVAKAYDEVKNNE